jgi:hypothetical protein
MKALNNLKYNLLILASAILLLGSCTEDFTPTLDTTYTRLVVDGAITTDYKVHRVTLSKSGDALNKNPKQYINDAIVTISDGTDLITLVKNDTADGAYETPEMMGIPGKTYILNISNVDIDGDGNKETYTASSLLKAINPIDSIQTIPQKYSSDEYGWLVNMFSRDIGGRSFYLTKVYVNDTLVTDTISEFGTANNIGFSGAYYPGLSVYYLSHDKKDEKIAENDKITLELDGITEEYYNFIDGCQFEISEKDPIFSGPSANVITNISPSDKAVGFFAAYSVQRKSMIYKEVK